MAPIMLSPEILQATNRAVLAWLATVDADGCPNVSPKEVFAVVDDRAFVIAHIASPQTVRNLQAQPLACLSFVDVFAQKGFKVKGHASVLPRTDVAFAQWAAPLQAMVQGRFPIHAVIVLHPQSVEAIVAPSYRLYPHETTEATQIAAAMHRYGVRPL